MKRKRTITGMTALLAGVLLLAGCTNEITQPGRRDDGKARVSFTTPTVKEATETRAVLAEKTTVRVVAYVAGGMDYKAEQSYFMDNDGKLKPCTVNDDGTFKAVDTTSELALYPDTYDFYAYTPALPMNADKKTINVPNGIDYASSATTGIQVSTDQTLPLTELARKCAKIALVVEKAADNTEMTELAVTGNGVTLSVLPPTATNVSLNTDIPAAAGTATLKVPAASFSPNGTTSTAITYLLPRLGTARIALTYDLTYKATGITESKTVNGTMGNIALDKGKNYTFTLTVRKTGATLSVKDWIDGGSQEVNLSPVDYTDNNQAWFTIVGGDAYSPLDLSKTTMDWYVATGTVDATYNPQGRKPCPDGWRIPDLPEMHLMWIYKQATPHMEYTSSDYYWTARDNGTYGWKVSMFNGSVFYNTTTEKSVQLYVRCIRDVASPKSYPYTTFNTSGEKRVIVSQDDNGGVRAGAIRATIMGAMPDHIQTDDTFNSVPARLEVAKKDCDNTTAPGVAQTNGTYSWVDAPSACAAYHESADHSDTWRLPTQRELMLTWVANQKGIFDNTISPFITTNYRTATAITSAGNTLAWITNMGTGASTTGRKTDLFRVRCVRDNVEQPKPILVGQFGGWDGNKYTMQLQVDWSTITYDEINKQQWSNTNIVTGVTAVNDGITCVNALKKLSPDLSAYPAAKYCASKGNGWYLPSQNQLMAIWVAYKGISSEFSLYPNLYWSATENGQDYGWYVNFGSGYTNGTYKNAPQSVRCVRNAAPSGKTTPKVITNGSRFIIDSRDMPAGAITFNKKVTSTNVIDNVTLGSMDPLANIGSTKSNEQLYSYLEVAKSDLKSSDWLGAVQGCDNVAADANGKWRLPTQREMILIWILKKNLENNADFEPLGEKNYWTATEHNKTDSWFLNLKHGLVYTKAKTEPYYVRCVRDL